VGLGRVVEEKMDRMAKAAKRARGRLSRCLFIDYSLIREALAEFLGTALLVVFGDGSVAQFVLSKGSLGSPLSIHFSWGFAVTIAVYVSGGVSGGHINPAISLTMWVLGRLSLLRLMVYSLAQYLGAMFGAALVYAVYYEALVDFDGGKRMVDGDKGTAGIFSTYPQGYLTAGGGLGDQIFGTCLLSLCVLAITDPRNMEVPKGFIPLVVGFTVTVIGMTFGSNCGYAINPARDLAPRAFTAMAGWGIGVFSYRGYNWFWVPVVGPYLGAVVGGLVYQLTIGNHWPHKAQPTPQEVKESPQHTSLDVNISSQVEARRSEQSEPR
jgi:MIP family channel proteins